MSKTQLTPKIARWALFLEDFNYEIVHRLGKQMKSQYQNQRRLLKKESTEWFVKDRENIREEAKKNILKIQGENRRNYNKKRKKADQCKVEDFVAIQQTQFGTGLKLRSKFFDPYEVVKVKLKDRYDVKKVGQYERPNITSTAADHMKMWGRIS
ncbi:hypothetical protein AVEN_234421-1 [Araneus ventricosus]|uniref:Uncharacterized protein n=1 Tax=Araneus ventricosus TaxID=182803 RepID=A0A4Y2A8V8_ARAVE|nr:hypothetical protein AVEN_234421-1 [Araneus ventricosus]